MSRPRLGRDPSNVITLRMPPDVAEQFEIEARSAGKTRSEIVRDLIWRWLVRRQAIRDSLLGRKDD